MITSVSSLEQSLLNSGHMDIICILIFIMCPSVYNECRQHFQLTKTFLFSWCSLAQPPGFFALFQLDFRGNHATDVFSSILKSIKKLASSLFSMNYLKKKKNHFQTHLKHGSEDLYHRFSHEELKFLIITTSFIIHLHVP